MPPLQMMIDGQVVDMPDALAASLPQAAPPPVPPRVVLPLDYRRRLPDASRAAITVAAFAALRATPPDPTLQMFLDDLSASRQVELDDPRTAGGVAALLAFGLIDAAEAEALEADPSPAEAAAVRAAGILA